MPLLALALDISWEGVYAFYVPEPPLERLIFTLWLVIDCGMVYGMIKYAKYEWPHSLIVARKIGDYLHYDGYWCYARPLDLCKVMD